MRDEQRATENFQSDAFRVSHTLRRFIANILKIGTGKLMTARLYLSGLSILIVESCIHSDW